MNNHTYYTAAGSFIRKVNSQGQSCLVIIIDQQEYGVDIQEMALWTVLNNAYAPGEGGTAGRRRDLDVPRWAG